MRSETVLNVVLAVFIAAASYVLSQLSQNTYLFYIAAVITAATGLFLLWRLLWAGAARFGAKRMGAYLFIASGMFAVLTVLAFLGGALLHGVRNNQRIDNSSAVPIIPSYSGTLVAPRTSVILSGKDHAITQQLEIGASGTILFATEPSAKPFFNFFDQDNLLVELIEGTLKVSTTIHDKTGHLLVELVRNEWKVAPPPNTWDRNYTKVSGALAPRPLGLTIR